MTESDCAIPCELKKRYLKIFPLFYFTVSLGFNKLAPK